MSQPTDHTTLIAKTIAAPTLATLIAGLLGSIIDKQSKQTDHATAISFAAVGAVVGIAYAGNEWKKAYTKASPRTQQTIKNIAAMIVGTAGFVGACSALGAFWAGFSMKNNTTWANQQSVKTGAIIGASSGALLVGVITLTKWCHHYRLMRSRQQAPSLQQHTLQAYQVIAVINALTQFNLTERLLQTNNNNPLNHEMKHTTIPQVC